MSDAHKPALKPANDNAWYSLATLYGEQAVGQIDGEVAVRSRLAWNRWMVTTGVLAAMVSDEEGPSLVRNGFTAAEFIRLSREEKDVFCLVTIVSASWTRSR
jgi:hypothetical protein